jgi:hypothetical protein
MIANGRVRGALPALGQQKTPATIPHSDQSDKEFRHRSVCAAGQPAFPHVSWYIRLSGSDREFPRLTGRSGTQRARRLRSHWLKQLLGARRPGARLLLYWRERALLPERMNPYLSQTLTVAALALPGPSLSLRPRRRQKKAALYQGVRGLLMGV